jgi:hypothetical protein
MHFVGVGKNRTCTGFHTIYDDKVRGGLDQDWSSRKPPE